MKAARITDIHVCTAPLESGTGTHVGGKIQASGPRTVFINGQMAVTVKDICICPGAPNSIVKGSKSVFINGLPAARQGDPTAHQGKVSTGSPNVSIGPSTAV